VVDPPLYCSVRWLPPLVTWLLYCLIKWLNQFWSSVQVQKNALAMFRNLSDLCLLPRFCLPFRTGRQPTAPSFELTSGRDAEIFPDTFLRRLQI